MITLDINLTDQQDSNLSLQTDTSAPPLAPTSSFKGPLSVAEQSDLARCERTIERGLQNFVEVGNALLEVSDRRLYREQFSTFKEYVLAKWQMSAARAYQLCKAAEVIKDLPEKSQQLLTNEAQIRELAKAPQDQRVNVLLEAGSDGKPTARSIKHRVALLKKPPETAQDKVSVLVTSDVDAQGNSTKQTSSLVDKNGNASLEDINRQAMRVCSLADQYLEQFPEKAKRNYERQKIIKMLRKVFHGYMPKPIRKNRGATHHEAANS